MEGSPTDRSIDNGPMRWRPARGAWRTTGCACIPIRSLEPYRPYGRRPWRSYPLTTSPIGAWRLRTTTTTASPRATWATIQPAKGSRCRSSNRNEGTLVRQPREAAAPRSLHDITRLATYGRAHDSVGRRCHQSSRYLARRDRADPAARARVLRATEARVSRAAHRAVVVAGRGRGPACRA